MSYFNPAPCALPPDALCRFLRQAISRLGRLAVIGFFLSIIPAKAICGTGGLTLTATVNNVSYDYIGYYYYFNLTYSAGIYYNGSIDLTVTGGTGPYSYTLTSPLNKYQSYGDFTSLGPGTYTFVISDNNGLTIDTTITITSVHPQPSIALSNIVYPTSCTNADGSFTLTGSGGTPPYTYSIDGGVTFTSNNTFTNLTGGAYPLLLVKDAHGMLGSTGFNPNLFSGNYFSGPCAFVILPDLEGVASCTDNTGVVTVSSTGGTPPIQYSSDGITYYPGTKTYYSPTLNSLDSQYNYTFTHLPPGITKLYAKDSNGVVTECAITVLEVCNFNITAVTVGASCQQNDGSITLTPINGTPPYSYSLDGVNFQTSNVFTGLASAIYNPVAKDANNLLCTVNAIVANNCPTVSLTETDATCGMKNGTITATGYKGPTPYQFSIDGINYQTNNVFTGLASGGYTVTIKDANGFTSTAYIIVNNNCLQLTVAAAGSTCGYKNGSIAASGTNGTAPYQFSLDNINFQDGSIFDSLLAGNYTVFVKDAAGLTTSATTVVPGAPGPQMSVVALPASCQNTNGSITINAAGGTAPLQFSINGGAGAQASNTFGGLDSGKYIAWVADLNSCFVADTIALAALPTPSLSLGNDTILCAGDSLLLQAPDSVTYQYQWQDGSQGDSYTVKGQGVYSVQVTNQYNCSASASVSVDYRPLPPVSLGNDTALCSGQTLSLTPVLPSQGTYLWSNGTTGTSLAVNSAGLYWIQLTDYGCRNSDSIQVTYKPSPVVNLGDDTTLCAGQTLLLDATNNNAVYVWQDGSWLPVFTVSRAGTYSVKVDENGCDTSGSVVVSYITKPVVSLGNDTTLCVSELLALDGSYPQSTYRWQDGSTQAVYNVSVAGVYAVDVVNVCGDTRDSVVVTYQNCACQFHVPTAFTPNNDGVNDIFLPKNYCPFSEYEVKVFDRWGKMVFDSKNAAVGWDGQAGNQPQPSGTYVWELVYRDGVTGGVVLKKGTVVLIR